MTITSQIKSILAASTARANAASKGPWKSRDNHKPYKVVWISEKDNYCTLELEPKDADFIAKARMDIPRRDAALLVAVEAIGECSHFWQAVAAKYGEDHDLKDAEHRAIKARDAALESILKLLNP